MRLLKLLGRYWQWCTASRRNANIDYYLGVIVIFTLVGFWFAVAGYYTGTLLTLLGIGVSALAIRRDRRRKA